VRRGGDSEGEDGVSRKVRIPLGRITQFLELADLMAVLMVLATTFSAIATWRTANIADALYLAAERPYFGVESVRLDHSRTDDPRVVVEYEDLGQLSAEGVVITGRLALDDRTIPGQEWSKDAGILSPQVRHYLHFRLPAEVYPAVMSGRSKLTVMLAAKYDGPFGRQLCYLERFVYMPDAAAFDVDGGTPRCENQNPG
jgi:hypothetical protein